MTPSQPPINPPNKKQQQSKQVVMSYQQSDCFFLFHVNIIPIKGDAEIWLYLSY